MTQHQEGARWVRNAALAKYCGVTQVTVWRWQRDPALNFPQPAIINHQPYTDLNAVDAWMRARVVNRATAAA